MTIPRVIRSYLQLQVGSKIDFIIDEQGAVKVIPLNVPVEELSSILHREGVKPVTLANMEFNIQEGASDWT